MSEEVPTSDPSLERDQGANQDQKDVGGASTNGGSTQMPASRLIEVMPRWVVIILAIGSVVGASSLCLIGVFYPTLIPSQTSRFFVCLLTAFLFAVFVFTLYPADFRLEVGKLIKIPFVLVGPAALWIALFLLFWYVLPREDTAGKLFTPPSGNDQLTFSTSWVVRWKQVQPTYYKLKFTDDQNSDDPNVLAAFYVRFDESHSEYTAEVGIGPSSEEIGNRYEVTFSRGASSYKLMPLGR